MSQQIEYEDLAQMFRESEAELGDDRFVDRVMQPIRRRARMRRAVLFGAGGIGVGAAASQVLGAVSLRWSQFGLDVTPLYNSARASLADASLPTDPVMLAGLAMLGVTLVAMATLERT